MTLNEVAIGSSVKVSKVNGEGKLRRRLFDMGVTPGAEIYLRKKAPLGDPLEVTLRGYELTLRLAEAQFVEVELVSSPEGGK
ncbi:MAG: ferrous iron transport protein A [Bacillota bacterium]|nr:ferrous iron transport protein A [Bacillota bacterium]